MKASTTDSNIKQLPCGLTNPAGLALNGKYLKRINIDAWTDPVFVGRWGIAKRGVASNYVGLRYLGKTDFIPSGLRAVPSSRRAPAHEHACCHVA